MTRIIWKGSWCRGGRKGIGNLYKKNGKIIEQNWNEQEDISYAVVEPPKYPPGMWEADE